MLIGKYTHNVDSKGRMIIPVKYRADLGDRFIITRGLDGCLFLLPTERFEEMCATLNEKVAADSQGRKLRRYFIGHSAELTLDEQGRVVIPPDLREFANIAGPTVIVGVEKRIEIWNAEAWEKAESMVEESDIEDIFETTGIII